MKITPKNYAEAFLKLASGKNEEQTTALAREFVAYFVKRGKTKQLRVIISKLALLISKQEGVRRIAVTVSLEQKNLSSLLSNALASLGGKQELSIHADPSIIGGMIFEIDDVRVDASIRQQLVRLRTHIKS